jgi:hypothetical protein
MTTAAGYSGTPLAKKLGWRPGTRVELWNAPADYARWLGPAAAELELAAGRPSGPFAAGHLFATERAVLGVALAKLRRRIAPGGMLWISWPKKSSGVPTDVTEDAIRELALPLGFVDVKVCAVTEVWSGLKLVVRRSER